MRFDEGSLAPARGLVSRRASPSLVVAECGGFSEQARADRACHSGGAIGGKLCGAVRGNAGLQQKGAR